MSAQELIIFEPNLAEESKALIAFGNALKLKFKIGERKENDGGQEIKITEWHKTIVAERLEDYRKNPQNNLNFDVMLKNIRQKYNL